MKRREFISGLAGATAAWPLPLGAQSAVPVIGFLNGFSAAEWAGPVAAFHKGLAETGFVEGQNVAIEYRWAEGQLDRLPTLAVELVSRRVAVLVSTGGSVTAVRAAKAASAMIPVVFAMGADPVSLGLVASFGRPGGNVTGVYFVTAELEAKRLGLLRELVPGATLIGVLVNPKYSQARVQLESLEAAALTAGRQIHIVHASTETEFDAAFATLTQARAGALLVGADPFFNTRHDTIVTLAARHAIPAIYEQREFAMAGGLMSYGTSITDATRQVGIYTGRVLKGEKPADLPVLQSSRFELVINLKTAKALGLTIPPAVLLGVDEVIE